MLIVCQIIYFSVLYFTTIIVFTFFLPYLFFQQNNKCIAYAVKIIYSATKVLCYTLALKEYILNIF